MNRPRAVVLCRSSDRSFPQIALLFYFDSVWLLLIRLFGDGHFGICARFNRAADFFSDVHNTQYAIYRLSVPSTTALIGFFTQRIPVFINFAVLCRGCIERRVIFQATGVDRMLFLCWICVFRLVCHFGARLPD